MDLERFRQVLRRCRRSLVGSQEQLSERTKTPDGATPINLNTISAIERGDTDDPGIVTIARLVEAMPGLTLSEFFRQVERDDAAVLNESGAPSLSAALTSEQYEQVIRALTTVAIEANSGKFRPDGRPLTGDGRRATGNDPRDRALHPHHAESPRPRRKTTLQQSRPRRKR